MAKRQGEVMKRDMIITTTDILQGYDILAYEGYIEASSTIGSGFMTEFLSSWTDTFGTKSTIIENKLHIIKEEVLKKLINQAINKKCNAIIGLHIDIDEISSNQKMIFMVTACGTAIKCRKQSEQSSDFHVSGDYLSKKILLSTSYRQQLSELTHYFQTNVGGTLEKFNELTLQLYNEGYFDFIEKDYMQCLLYGALGRHANDIIDDNIKEYIDNFNQENLIHAYLEVLLDMATRQDEILQYRKTFSYATLCSYMSAIIPLSTILTYLEEDNDFLSVIVLYPLLKNFKAYYKHEDIVTLAKIINQLKARYWNEEIHLEELKEGMKICVCGKLITQTPCTCGATQTINITTFTDKKHVIDHLTVLHNELKVLFETA